MLTRARDWIGRRRAHLFTLAALIVVLLAGVALTPVHTLTWNAVARHCGSITVWDEAFGQAARAETPAAARPAVTCLSSAFASCRPAGLEVRERGTDWAFSRLWVVEPHLGGCSVSSGAFTCQTARWATASFPHGEAGVYTAEGVLLGACGDHVDTFLPATGEMPSARAGSSGGL